MSKEKAIVVETMLVDWDREAKREAIKERQAEKRRQRRIRKMLRVIKNAVVVTTTFVAMTTIGLAGAWLWSFGGEFETVTLIALAAIIWLLWFVMKNREMLSE